MPVVRANIWGRPDGQGFGAFLYRYILLEQLFPPSLVQPNVEWRYQTTELLNSGSVSLFLATYPIAALLSIENAFKTQPILVIILLPVLLYLSGRLLRFRRPSLSSPPRLLWS